MNLQALTAKPLHATSESNSPIGQSAAIQRENVQLSLDDNKCSFCHGDILNPQIT